MTTPTREPAERSTATRQNAAAGPAGVSAAPPGYGIPFLDTPQVKSKDAAPTMDADGLAASTKQDIIDGKYADKGQYKLQVSRQTVKETVHTWKLGKKIASEVEHTETLIDSTFTDPTLQKAKQYLDTNWAGTIDISKATGGSGDTKGKRIDMPGWVYSYQDKLAAQKPKDYVPKSWEKDTNPAWGEDSFLAQRVVEAFLRAWHKQELPDTQNAPSNVEELYKRVGVSEKAYGNAQATLLGDPNVYGWCGPASYNAVVLGLLRHGFRLKTGKGPVTAAVLEKRNKQQASYIRNSIKWKNKTLSEAEVDARYQAELAKMAFLEEVNSQAAFLITNNSRKSPGWLKPERFVTGEEAYAKYPLQPGDVITQALMNGSPVSGHVLTVVKEERNPVISAEAGSAVSTIYGISGNAGSIGGGSVKIEKFTREMPPASLKADLGPMSSLGNRMTVAVDERRQVEKAETARLAKEQNLPLHKVAKEDIEKATDVRRAEKRSALQAELTAAEGEFSSKAGMSYDDYIRARNAKSSPLSIIHLGQTHKDLLAKIARLKGSIRAIDDYTAVPAEAAARDIAYSPALDAKRYATPSGHTGRFRPNELGHMWITTIIKAGEFADAHKIEAELRLAPAVREKKIKEMGWDANTSPEKYKELVLDRHGAEQLPGSVDTLWPGAIAAIEGAGLAKDYRSAQPDGP